MKIFKLHIALILFAYFTCGCEDISNVEIDLDYKEFIVVQSELNAEKKFEGVLLTKTLPVEDFYDIKKAEITNAIAFIKVNGTQVIPIHYTIDGLYKPLYEIKIRPETYYELFVKINGKSIYAKTYVPALPEVEKVFYREELYLTGNVFPKKDEAYGALWVVQGGENPISKAEDFFSVASTGTESINSLLPVRTQDVSEDYRNNIYKGITYIKIFAFDIAYADYFKTKNNNQPIENSFTSGGGPVDWNVQGENTIGMFIGLSETNLIKPVNE